MTNLTGTNIAATIVPFTTEDTYPTHDALYGKGGWRTVATIIERDLIPQSRLDRGCIVLVLDSGIPWQWMSGTWVDFRLNGLRGIKGDTGDTGPRGATGDMGPIGPEGPVGLRGEVGPAGDQGFDGPQGPAGDTGKTGPVGPVGPQGIAGLGLTNRREWVAGTMYSAGDYVFRTGSGGGNTTLVTYGEHTVTYNDIEIQYGTPGLGGNSIFVANFESYVSNIEPRDDTTHWNEVYAPAGPRGFSGDRGPMGIAGTPGLTGPTGPRGLDGKGLTFRYAWAANTAYSVNDVVTYAGSTYIVTTAFTSGSTFSTTNITLLAAKGDTGPTGSTTGATTGGSINAVVTARAVVETYALRFSTTGNNTYDLTLAGDLQLTISGGVSGQLQQMTVIIRQPSVKGYKATLPQGIIWPQNVPPEITDTPNQISIFTVSTPDAGLTYFGNM